MGLDALLNAWLYGLEHPVFSEQCEGSFVSIFLSFLYPSLREGEHSDF